MRRLLENFQCGRSNKHSMVHIALEVANATDTSVVLSGIIIEFDTDPLAGLESGLASKSNESCPSTSAAF